VLGAGEHAYKDVLCRDVPVDLSKRTLVTRS
jgi:hypothetical protein